MSRIGCQVSGFALSSLRYRRRNARHRSTRWLNHCLSCVLGATSFIHVTAARASFVMPRGHRRSTRIRRPTPRAAGSYVRLTLNMQHCLLDWGPLVLSVVMQEITHHVQLVRSFAPLGVWLAAFGVLPPR